MKTVGKQLQEARLARNWTPELASRETKIRVDRLDLEGDDYSHFNNATYARGFVRTYARALGLDEYKILRQLDNKLPDDDTANIVSADGGVAYLPETAMPPRVAHRNLSGLYVVMGLGAAVMLVIAFVLFRAYQVGELGKWTGEETVASTPTTTNTAPAVASDAAPRAKPVDSETPPPIPTAEPAQTNAVTAAAPTEDATANAPKALPVDLNAPQAQAATPTAPTANAPPAAPKALPVDPSTLNAANTTPAAPVAPKALPVDPATLNPATTPTPPPVAPKALPVDPATLNAVNNVPPPPRALPVNPTDLAATSGGAPVQGNVTPSPDSTQTPASNGPVVMPPSTDASAPATDGSMKPLVLTASRDAFVRVVMLDSGSGDKQVYADVLHSGQSVAFNGHKFSVNVANPSAVDIKLDGVNYGPHDDGTDPETFTIISHVQ